MPYPKPTVPAPSEDEVLELLHEAVYETNLDTFETTDGCEGYEPDGVCQHGHPTWLRYLGLI
jgi:hypothetical protein